VPDRPASEGREAEQADEETTEPLTLKDSFGTAVGAAMLGLEQALRNEPPPQIQVAEHTPDRRTVSGDDDLEIHLPELPARPIDEGP
jgi:hypothetical protein